MFEYWICLEPCMLNSTSRDYGVSTWLERVGRKVTGVGLLFGNDFMCMYGGYEENLQIKSMLGKNAQYVRWKYKELKKIIDCFHKKDVKVVIYHFSCWSHGAVPQEANQFLQRHPEMFMTSNEGEFMVGIDFNPLKNLKEDKELRIVEGTPFPDYYGDKVRQVIDDFGFDGIILVDGLQGFRCEPGKSSIPGSEVSLDYGIEKVDFSDNYVDLFCQRTGIKVPDGTTQKRSQYILKNRFEKWAEFNRKNWTSWFDGLRKKLRGRIFGTVDVYAYSLEYAYAKSGVDIASLKGKIDYFVVQSVEYGKGIAAGYGYPFNRETFGKIMIEAYRLLPGTKICCMQEIGDPNEGWDAIADRPDVIREELLYYLNLKVDGKKIVAGSFNPVDGHITSQQYRFVNDVIREGIGE